MRMSSFVETYPSLYPPQNKDHRHESPLSPKAFTTGPSLPVPLDAEACCILVSPVPGPEEKPECSGPQWQSLDHRCTQKSRRQRGGGKCLPAAPSGTASIPPPAAGARRWGVPGGLVRGGFLPSQKSEEWKPIQAECHSTRQALPSSQIKCLSFMT